MLRHHNKEESIWHDNLLVLVTTLRIDSRRRPQLVGLPGVVLRPRLNVDAGRNIEGKVVKWIIVAFLLNPVDEFEAFLLEKPHFNSQQECVDHVQEYGYGLYAYVLGQTNAEGVKNFWCVDQEKAKKMFTRGETEA